ncbi:MAG: TlpA family protein disulfide reductase [Rubrivivax sp.]|nr:TlpA family protein disulfide reductase [Rubrivivax sp.]
MAWRPRRPAPPGGRGGRGQRRAGPVTPGRPPRRATLLLAAAGAAAAAAGLAVGWRRQRAGTDPEAAIQAPAAAVHELRFLKPDGQELTLARFRGKPLLLNFWATWCPPCLREMPALDRFAREFGPRGWQVVGLAADQEKPVREFLSRNPVSYSIALVGFEAIALSRSLGNETGALPFTVAFDGAGKPMRRHLGETTFDALAGWAAEMARARPTTP